MNSMIYRIRLLVSIWKDGSGWFNENECIDTYEYYDFEDYSNHIPLITEWAKENYHEYTYEFDLYTPEYLLNRLDEIGEDYKVTLEMTEWDDEFSDPLFDRPKKCERWNLWLSDICKWRIGLITDEYLEKLANS